MTWKKKLGWVATVFIIVVVVLVAAGYLVLKSPGFHAYLLNEIEKLASQSLATSVRIQNFALQLPRLSATAYGITIASREESTPSPLAEADQLTVRIKIVSLLHKKFDLREIILLHPVVNLCVKKDGSTNLPTPRTSNSSRSPFDLGIERVLIERGEIYYNDVKTPLDAELHDIQVKIGANPFAKGYDGSLSYRDGRIRYGNMKPLPHDLNSNFNANRSELTFDSLILRVASSTLALKGQIRNYSQPSASASYTLEIHPQDVASAFRDTSVLRGDLKLTGSLEYSYKDNVPLMRSLALNGHLVAGELAVSTANFRTIIRNTRGEFTLEGGNLDVPRLEADLLGGHLTTTATIQHLDGNPITNVRASAQAISVSETNAALRNANLKPMPLAGRVDGTAQAMWAGSIKNIQARSNATLTGTLTTGSSGTTPVEGAAHLAYDGPSQTATLTSTLVRTPLTQFELNGTVGRILNLNLKAHASDLKEVNTFVAALQNVKTSETTAAASHSLVNVGGTADLQLTIQGTTKDPHLRGQLTGQNLQVESTEWRSLNLNVEATQSGVSIRNGSLVNARKGYVNFTVTTGLSDWRYQPTSPISAEVTSRDLDIKKLLQAARLDYPVSGIFSADLSLHGSQVSPAGTASVRLTQAIVYGQPLKQLSVKATGNGEAVVSSANFNLPGAEVNANLTFYPKRKAYEVQLDAPGISIGELQPVRQKNLSIQGVLSARATGSGTIDNPQLMIAAQIPQLRVRDVTISGIKGDVSIANHEANLTLDSEVAETPVQVRGTVSLSDGHYAKATIDTKQIQIERLLALFTYRKTNGPHGILEVHASAQGPLADTARMQAEITIPTLKAGYESLQIGNTRPIHARYASSLFTLDPAELAGTDTDLKIQGQLPLKGNAPMTLAAAGNIDMQLLRLVQPDVQSSGKIQVDLRGTGSAGNPNVHGQLRVENVSMIPASSLVGVQNLNGLLEISNDQVSITQLSGESGGGQISAEGTISYRPQIQMNVVAHAKSVRIRYQDAVRAVLDGNVNLVGTTQAATLNGRVLIDNLSFTQNFDLATFAGQFQSETETAPTEGFGNRVKLDVAVQTGPGLNLTSSEVSLQGQANLHVVGTAADPVIVGRAEFNSGDIFFLNGRYQIEHGLIQFQNPRRTEPVIDVRLTTTIDQYNLTLTFRGPLDRLQTSYLSDPTLPTADIINLIARGQTAQAAASTSSFGASSLIAKGAASRVSSQVQQLAGLSSFSIDPTLGGNNPDPGARIALQKRVTKNFLFTFATDVTSTQRELIQGEYRISSRWSATATRDENGGIAVDGKYHKRF